MGVARRAFLLVMIAMMQAACLIPIPASPEEQDGGAGGPSDPIVLESNPPMPGPISINLESPFPVSLTLRDANVRDTLFVRVFRDYKTEPERGPVTDREFRNDAAMGTEDRLVILETNSWCQNLSADQLGTTVVFEVVVADRQFNPDSTVMPFFQVVMGNGRFSRSYWLAKCVSSPF